METSDDHKWPEMTINDVTPSFRTSFCLGVLCKTFGDPFAHNQSVISALLLLTLLQPWRALGLQTTSVLCVVEPYWSLNGPLQPIRSSLLTCRKN